MAISIILAVAENGVIGNDNTLVWRLKEDMRQFKKLTSGNVVLMGRNTFESIGKPLANRTNIIVTRNKEYVQPGCIITHSLEEALESAKSFRKDIFIIGGADIYNQSIPHIEKVYLTRVMGKPQGDATFDMTLLKNFVTISSEFYSKNEDNEYDVYFEELQKNDSTQ